MIENLLRDLKLGLRQLRRSPGYSLAVIFALTLGVGAATAMLIVIDAVLLEALPYEEPDELMVLTGTFTQDGATQDWPISQMDFDDWDERQESFSGLAVFTPGPLDFNYRGDGEPERLNGELVSNDYFDVLAIEPEVGRFFAPDEGHEPFADPIAVLSHSLWSQRFGSDPEVVGTTLELNGRAYQVIGVAPEGFTGLTDEAQVWVPSNMPPGPDFLTIRRFRWLGAVGRLAPGVSREQAQEEMNAITGALEDEFPDQNAGMGVKVTSLRDYWFGPLRAGLLFLLLGAGILLLIACVDVANLTMTRAVERQHAVAVRTAMGASRTRLVRQLFTESLLLAVIGSALGLLLAGWTTRLLVAISGVDFQSFIDFRAGLPVVGAVAALALVLGIVFGVVPLWVTLRGDAVQTLHRQGKNPVKGFGRHGFQSSVVIAQVALALTLAVGAGLIAKGYRHLVSQDLGYQPKELLTLRMDLKGDQWSDDHDVIRLVERLLDKLEPLPGVASVAIAGPTIPTDDWAGGYVTLEDYVSDSPDGTVPVMMHAVTPDYFETLGASIVKGDVFTMQDRESSRVVIAKALADRYWPGQDPIGKQLKFGARNNMERPWLTVMGVADDIDQAGPLGLERPAPDIYVPALQFQVRLPLRLNFLVRPEPGLAAASLGERVRAAIQEEAPDLAVYDVRTMEQRLATQTEHGRFEVILVTLFTFIALVLAIIGVYGVISYGVAQRTREIGIRMALGADRSDVLRLVVLRGTLLAAIGLGIGLAAVLLMRGWLEELMYGTSAMDPVILIGTSVLLLAVTAVASFVPARRASRLEPVRGLRSE